VIVIRHLAAVEAVNRTPSVSKYMWSLTFFYSFDHSSIQIIVQVKFILFAKSLIVVCILSFTYPFTCLR
jgi:hypothetical protein